MNARITPEVPGGAPKKGEEYQHYKGGRYRVVDLALHSTEEWVVIYEPLYDAPIKLFTRPVAEWQDSVTWEGKRVPRFTLLK